MNSYLGFLGSSTYNYCGLPIISNVVIPELPKKKVDKGEFLLTVESLQPRIGNKLHSFYWREPHGDILLAFCKEDNYSWLSFPKL